MNIVFINPPSVQSDTHDLAPPLWALLLGSTARQAEYDPIILDLGLEVLDKQAPQHSEEFYSWITEIILEKSPKIVCYTSMGLNGHVSLKIAEHVSCADPSILHFFGGPHFSAVAEAVLQHYPWVDAVFLGEAEDTLLKCLRHLRAGQDISTLRLPGILTRGNSLRTRERAPVAPDDVPKPAYDLVSLSRYFAVNPRRVLDFEAGRRGCIFACRFCYAPEHFGRGERAPSIARFIQEMAAAAHVGARHLFIVTDNFVNYPRETTELCKEIAAAHLGLTFNCYATLAQLTEPVIAALARAGCTSLYVGVDAVHPEARREFAKGQFRSRHDLLNRIDLCLAHEITPNLAFLLEEPEKGKERFVDTVATALAGVIRGCSVAFNTLTVYPRTALAEAREWTFDPCDLKARICFDAPEVVLQNPYSTQHPELFPFHSSHRSEGTHGKTLMFAHALKSLAGCAPMALYEMCERGALLECLELLLDDITPAEFAFMPALKRREIVIETFLSLCRTR
jgi:hypothetical protein